MSYSAMELAEAFLKTGELDDALDAIKQQLDESPGDDEARRLHIQIQMRLLPQQELPQLLSEFEKLNEKQVSDWQTKSIIFERSGQFAEAISAMQSALQLVSEDERLTERLLDLLLGAESYDDALELVREQEKNWRWLEREGDVLVLIGDDMLATARYGLVLAHLEELEGVLREDYLQALRVRVMLARAHAYRRLEHLDIAKELYHASQSIMGQDITIQFNLGLIAEMEGDSETAQSLCWGALEKASSGLKTAMIAGLSEDSRFESLKQALSV